MKTALTSIVILLAVWTYGQNPIIYIHDLENGTLDSIVSYPIDTTLSSGQTNYYEGIHSSNIAPLSDVFPTLNTFPQSEFTRKRRVALDYSTDDFPIRAAVKTFGVENGELSGQCSGAMISRKHVLTATHCQLTGGTNDLMRDTILVCPAYDDGLEHPDFGCVRVNKVYFIKNWNFHQDFAVLELSEDIGYETGWMGVGFEEDSATVVNRMHYKFSYPAAYEPFLDSNVYNGDTMYYSYGKLNYLTNSYLGVQGGSGIPGESGSPMIHIENNQTYTVYGTFTFVSNMIHVRLKNWAYHAILAVIENDVNVDEPEDDTPFVVYPNPATSTLHVKGLTSESVLDIQNSIGQSVSGWRQENNQIFIDPLETGIYFLILDTPNGKTSVRFVKQ